MNYHELLNKAKQELAAAGKAESDAKELLLFLKNWRLQDYLLTGKAEVPAADAASYHALLERRMVGVPLQEITGSQNFYGYEIAVSPDVLTPRPETELLVELALKEMAGLAQPQVLDLCTGSGCIAIVLAAENPAAEVTAVDISEKALAQARKNCERHGLNSRIKWRQSDLFAGLSAAKFDVIVSNPPYIPAAEIKGLEVEVRNYDPELALDGGTDGLDFYRRIAGRAASYLRRGSAGYRREPADLIEEKQVATEESEAKSTEPGGALLQEKVRGGRLLLEIGCGQGAAVAQLLQVNGWQEIRILPDLTGRERIITATAPRTEVEL